ncbi:hypothetical protein [Streptomyces sp. NPDC056291]|uniref:hypothetical protein n=1 Tax=Streptomyces sp. NPDC056291 TaxID=3345772 RepID=UPI0035E1CC56
MDIRKIARSLKPGDDKALARTDYPGQPSATETAAAARRAGHRKAVGKLAANTRKDAGRDIRGR